MTRSPLSLALIAVMSVVFGITALLIINTTFMMYDDEGYVLLSYRNFIAGQRLYDDIFSQYGPVPYLYNWTVSLLLHSPFTHILGRGLTAFHWTLCALLSCAVCLRLTGSRIGGLIGGLATFGLLWQLACEPSHPGGLICMILAVSVYAVCCFNESRRWHLLAATLGLTAALLSLTKINIGAFFIAGSGAGLLLLTRWPERWRPSAFALAGLGLLVLPWALMWGRLDHSSFLILALQFSLGILGLLWLLSADRTDPSIPPRTWMTGLVVFVIVTAFICLLLTVRGTEMRSLVKAVLLDPLRHPAHFQLPIRWPDSIWPVTAISLSVALISGWEMRRHGAIKPRTRLLVSILRIGVALFFVWEIQRWPTLLGAGFFATHALALLPLFLIPLYGKKMAQGMIWVALIAFTQVLHVYPVAGSQMGWGSFLMIPVFVAGLHAVWTLKPRYAKALRLLPAGLVIAACFPVGLLLQTGWERYRTSRPLDLPGAEGIRVNDATRQILRLLTLNAGIHADTLFSRPGMFSYNIWSGVPTPSSKNATHWFWLLDDSDQQEIIGRLAAAPHPAMISSKFLEDFLVRIGVPLTSPLQDYFATHYKSLFEVNSFHFWVPKNSKAVPFGLIDTFVSAQETTGTPSIILQSHIVLNGQPASVRLQLMEHPWSVIHDYTTHQARIILEPVTTYGALLGAPVEFSAAGNLKGLYRIRIYTNDRPDPAKLNQFTLTVLDTQENVLSESIFVN